MLVGRSMILTGKLTMRWMFNIKDVRCKARLHVSVNLLSWSMAAMLPTSSSRVRAHEQYR